jgi:hypothetical protein
MTLGESLSLLARWRGPIHVDDDRGLAVLAITDDEAYDRLLARLPAQRVQMKQPAPPSDDPLRARPPIDFGVHMLVVVIRAGSLAPIEIAQVVRDGNGNGNGDGGGGGGGGVQVRFAAAPAPPAAQPWGVGVYAAVLVARADGPLELVGPRVVLDAADVDDAVGELVTVRGVLAPTRLPTILGVDGEAGSADRGEAAEATGWLERDVVTPTELDELIGERGQVAHRGAGTFHRLVAIDGEGLAPAHRRW